MTKDEIARPKIQQISTFVELFLTASKTGFLRFCENSAHIIHMKCTEIRHFQKKYVSKTTFRCMSVWTGTLHSFDPATFFEVYLGAHFEAYLETFLRGIRDVKDRAAVQNLCPC